ncbi:3105_t:CDS:1 [Ambispora gerdemannii]|uniref:3105_t:CDS:1 n=1 Tax=Ambispora gerdemannii TaxID=144530 RepID=A0A9N9F8F2_9GLOM|nr:3105_t:CDS:1 [Ambispora gerdemannii]
MEKEREKQKEEEEERELAACLNNSTLVGTRLKRYAAEAGDVRYMSPINLTLKTETKHLRERVISGTLNNIKRSMEVDLCFVLDCTGSMGGHIDAAKDCIITVVEHMSRTNPNIKLWVSFCGYRDHCDGDSRLQIFEFTNLYSKFKSYISEQVSATGGGDAPEDVLGGLDAAVDKIKWTHTTRIILHVGDAPPHGVRFYTGQDEYPRGDPNGLTAESVLERMRSAQIFYYFGKITNLTDEMLRVFHSIIGEFPEFDLNIDGGNPEALCTKFFNATCSAITSSVTITSTMAEGMQNRRKDLEIDISKPAWFLLPVETGVLLHYHSCESLDDIMNPRHFKKSNIITQKYTYKRAPKPFSVGAERYAYYALDVAHEPNATVIMKEYLELGRQANSMERYLEAIEVSTISCFLAKEFNSAAARVGVDKKVEFLQVKLVRRTDTQCHTVEPILPSADFKRFNVNSGVITEFRATLEAFAHFTYKFTGGYLVVYDLQGTELSDQFLLTDPAIHCTDPLRFGRTNLGKKGIDECFLANHKCNDVCQKLGFEL